MVSAIYNVNTLLGARGVLTSLSAFSPWNGALMTALSTLSAQNAGSIALMLSGFNIGNSSLTQDASVKWNIYDSANFSVSGSLSAATSLTIGTSGTAIHSYFFGSSALVAGVVLVSCPGCTTTSNVSLQRGPLNTSASIGELTVNGLSANKFLVVSYTSTLSVVGGDTSTVFYTVIN